MFPLEFHGDVRRQDTRVMGLLCGQSCMILTSSLWLIHPCDGQTDGQTEGRWHIAALSRYSIMLLRAKTVMCNARSWWHRSATVSVVGIYALYFALFFVCRWHFTNSCENNIQHDRQVWNFRHIRGDRSVYARTLSDHSQVLLSFMDTIPSVCKYRHKLDRDRRIWSRSSFHFYSTSA